MFKNCKIVGSNVSYETYSKQPDGVKRGHPKYVMSRGELIEFALCPSKWLASLNEDDSTTATNWGSLVDCLLTSPDQFDSLFIICPETYVNSNDKEMPWTLQSKTCRQWVAEKQQEGLTVLTSEVIAKAKSAVQVMRQNSDAVELLKVSQKQVHVTGFWEDKTTGLNIPVRALLDLVPPKEHPTMGKWLADLKSARNGDPEKWARVVDDCCDRFTIRPFFEGFHHPIGRRRVRPP